MKIRFTLEKPCSESLENMHTVPGGKFCDLCSKKVLDLSEKSDSDILKVLSKSNDQKICGAFFPLNVIEKAEPSILTTESNHSTKFDFSKIAAGLVLSASLVGNFPAQIHHPQKTEQNSTTKEKVENKNFQIIGTVLNEKTKKPMNGAEITLITTTKIYKTTSDKKGNFVLEVPPYLVKENNLLYFTSNSEMPSHKLISFSKKELENVQTVFIKDFSETYYAYGTIVQLYPYKNSFLSVNGKKLDYKIFNKSYMLYPDKYEMYYIPKEFVNVFTSDKKIEDAFIVFTK